MWTWIWAQNITGYTYQKTTLGKHSKECSDPPNRMANAQFLQSPPKQLANVASCNPLIFIVTVCVFASLCALSVRVSLLSLLSLSHCLLSSDLAAAYF